MVLLSGPSLLFTKHCVSKNTIKIGVSAHLKNCARKFEVLLSGPSWPFLSCSQLGPDNNTYLAQIITPQNGFVLLFLAFKMCWNTNCYSVFEHQPKFGKKGAKNDNFFTFCKTQVDKKPVLLQPPFWPTIVVFQLGFLNQKHWCWTKNITQNLEKAKIRKRDLKQKQDRKPPKKKIRKENCNWIFWCCSFHETKAKKKEKWKRDKNKKQKKSKKERQEGTKKDKNKRERERETEKEKLKKGEAKKG